MCSTLVCVPGFTVSRRFAMSSSARADGRTPWMMRQLKLERAFLSRADGSARWEQGA